MRADALPSSLMQASTLLGTCLVAISGAGLLSLVVHEGGHAAAIVLTGGRVLPIELDFTLRGGSRTLSYYPFVELAGYSDRYWVALGGVLATVGLGVLATLMLITAKRNLLLPGTMVVGTTFGALAMGTLRYSITGVRAEANDIVLFSHIVPAPLPAFRLLVGCVGGAFLVVAVVVTIRCLRRTIRAGGQAATTFVTRRFLPTAATAAAVITLWHFGADWASVIAIILLVMCSATIAHGLVRVPTRAGGQVPRTLNLAIQAIAILCVGLLAFVLLRAVVPNDSERAKSGRLGHGEHALRLAAYWAAERGDHAGSLGFLEEANRTYGTVGTMYDLGTAYRVQGRTQDAIRLLSEACTRAPGLAASWAQLAVAFEQQKDYEEAAAAWRTAVNLEIQNPDAIARERRIRVMNQRAAALESMIRLP